MADAERLTTASLLAGEGSATRAISLATIAAVAAALLTYVSSSFQIAEIFGIKREVQVLLILPIATAASYYFVSRPAQLLEPLILFSIVRLGTEIALRGQLSYVLDSLSVVLALVVLNRAPERSFQTAAAVLVAAAGILAFMAIVQWLIFVADPQLIRYALGPIDEGEVQGSIQHPIALLGLVLPHEYSLGGFNVGRMQSFAKEPSLNVVYFLFPSCLGFLRNTRASVLAGVVTLMYCVLSLSGSVFLACAFALTWWLVTRVIPIRFAVPYAMLILMVVYVITLSSSAAPLLQALDSLAQYGDFLSKSTSATARVGGAVENFAAALQSPLGSGATSDLPGPWLVNSALAAGWLGALLLFVFLAKFGRQLDQYSRHSRPYSHSRVGVMLMMGAMATVLVFNDYQMGNYSGMILLAFIYRTLQSSNERAASLEAETVRVESEGHA